MPKQKEKSTKPIKVYKVIDIHPTYESEEERQKAYEEVALGLARIGRRFGKC